MVVARKARAGLGHHFRGARQGLLEFGDARRSLPDAAPPARARGAAGVAHHRGGLGRGLVGQIGRDLFDRVLGLTAAPLEHEVLAVTRPESPAHRHRSTGQALIAIFSISKY